MTATMTPPLDLGQADLGRGVYSYPAMRWGVGRQIASWVMILLSLATVFLSPMAIWFAVILFRSPNYSKKSRAKRVDLYERGLVMVEEQGPVAVYRFDSMAVQQKITVNYYNGVKTGTHYLITVTGPDGSQTKLTKFYDRIDHLAQTLQEAVTQAQLGRALATAQAGYPVPFGPFTVAGEGVVADQKGLVTWALLDRMTVSQGSISVYVHGKRLPLVSRQVAQVPNFGLFLSLVGHLRGGA
ncbi:hypothetical protein ABIA32_002410 [Streptacidiphilus sp. MAP12-20]|uniref:DUF6585 family protein n=1 Tax=Streptacidiphilus sp. MAP12-20 TaxID=3156299 RepID=UPI0035175AB1